MKINKRPGSFIRHPRVFRRQACLPNKRGLPNKSGARKNGKMLIRAVLPNKSGGWKTPSLPVGIFYTFFLCHTGTNISGVLTSQSIVKNIVTWTGAYSPVKEETFTTNK